MITTLGVGRSLEYIPYMVATGGTMQQVGNFKFHLFTDTAQFQVIKEATDPARNLTKLFMIGGGAGGGFGHAACGGGGGGAGGYIYKLTYQLSSGVGIYTFVIGSGGTYGSAGSPSTNGGNTTFDGLIAIGGGRGLSNDYPNGGIGGSGGGGIGNAITTGAAGTVDQGNAGGNGVTAPNYNGGGGGGAGAVGQNATSSKGGDGGIGILINLLGANTYYGGGGGGGAYYQKTPGTGGLGGGGNGSVLAIATDGTVNTGGGGGGSGFNGNQLSGRGGKGVGIIGYLSPA